MKVFAVLLTLIYSWSCIASAANERAPHSVRRDLLFQGQGSHGFAPTDSSEWENFKTNFGKNYADATEEAKRKQIFEDNLKIILEHNKGNSTFTLGINQFSDMTTQEFDQQMLMKVPTIEAAPTNAYSPPNHTKDWTESGCVSPVQNQGACASSYAFSAITSTEFYICWTGMEHSKVQLSVQNLIDCTYSYGNEGCSSGTLDAAYEYIVDNGGINTEANYPYEAKESKDKICNSKFEDEGAELTGFTDIIKSEKQLEVTMKDGVLSASIDASGDLFKNYKSGIYSNPLCNNNQLNQAVAIVGYGSQVVEGGQLVPYWLIKNSWGTSWGEGGYFRMVRGVNMCGIANQASYPKVKFPNL